MGIKRGDMVAIYSKIQLYASVPLISCFFVGAVPTFLEDALTSLEVVHILKQINPKLILTTSEMLETVKELINTEVIHVNTEILVFDQGFYEPQENEREFLPIYVNDLKETAMIPFSSGSTGLPKGIRLSHYALLRANIINDDRLWLTDQAKIVFSYDSFHWSIETVRLLCSVRDGICRLIDPEPFEAERTWNLLEKFKVVDLNSGEALGPNKPGELHVKSDIVMSGYHNMDSSDQFHEDGWFKTGDEVFYDEDLCFFIVDRIKDMITFQGWHVPPAFLEEELLTHPAVKRAAVIGIPDEVDGEHPMALIVLKDNFKNVTSKDLERFIAERMPERFHLKAGVKFIDDSYFVGARKVKRYLLKKLVLTGKI
ncbi:luciferin 4-monooxygenase-like [Anoplophora glabripennis]|uniref:luciferin 4-monooxygenase-like n=1 Tax=Anoplophora glabripennis TaxID=217634 RepID=UPI0008740661|nr:luciferin 4-monooxygenase-like [Anoplophora glabripennis]